MRTYTITKAVRSQVHDDFVEAKYCFEMRWNGGNYSPVNAKVGNKSIDHAQGNRVWVRGAADKHQYTYVRTVRDGGQSRKEQVIVIATDMDSATNPDGTPCKDVTADRNKWIKIASELPLTPTKSWLAGLLSLGRKPRLIFE